MNEIKNKLAVAVAALLSCSTLVPAFATTVTPVIIDLQTAGRGVVANISVNNTGATALPIEAVTTALTPQADGLTTSDAATDDLLVVPPTALIPPGQTQTFRVQWIGDPEMSASKHYYVGINQLPVKLPEGESAVQIVYNFQVLVSVSSPGKKPNLSIKSAVADLSEGKPVAGVTVENNGEAHGYISQYKLKISETNSAGVETASKAISGSEFQQLVGYGLVATGQTRTVKVPMDKPSTPGTTLTAVLMDDRAQ